jgi:hypothetical protein
MTEADSVHSTPPTSTPIDTNRRRFLSVTVGAVAATIALPAFATAPADDPVFDLIEAHRRAHVAHMDALTLQDRLEVTTRTQDGFQKSHATMKTMHSRPWWLQPRPRCRV